MCNFGGGALLSYRQLRCEAVKQECGFNYCCHSVSLGEKIQLINKYVKSLFASQSFAMPKKGFTLAEVLITLGIIGVVAALTLPSLINNYRAKQLETSFKRTTSLIHKALNLTVQQEYGLGDFKEFKSFMCGGLAQFDPDKDKQSVCMAKIDAELVNFNQVLYKNLGVISSETITHSDGYLLQNFRGDSFNYAGLCELSADKKYSKCNIYYLRDGAAIFGLSYNEGQFRFIYDTNGVKRAPNRLGYDVWEYEYPKWRDDKHWCNRTNKSWMIGLGCYYFATRDINAEDKTKGYWNSLY